MNIVHIIPGSGGSFYCGNCLRDSKYYTSIKQLGHNVLKVPLYLPLFARDPDQEPVPVFYGAVSIYLKQLYPMFRHAPKWVDNILNATPVLRQAAKRAGSTRAKGLEEMTISMLLGEQGNQSDELDEMIVWLENHFRPDVIHISNALLLGLAPMLRSRLRVPVICSLQDEDVWVDVMSESNREKVWNLMSEKGKDVDAFISVSHFFTAFSMGKMDIPEEKVYTLHLGVDPDDYKFINSLEKDRSIGYLSRMCEENGLDILIDAFLILKKEASNNDIILYITGGSTGDDTAYIKAQKKKIKNAGLEAQVVFLGHFDNHERHIFFERVSVLSVPVRKGEAFGIYLTEAMASGIPVVQPALGAFPEIVEATGGGLIYDENTPEKLAGSLQALLSDKKLLGEKSINARKGVEEKFNIKKKAASLVEIYEKVAAPQATPTARV
ncbi:MAG: glycosyltransferase family 4 protein [Bacteroidales bacterium]